MNNMRMIMLAVRSYEEQHGSFPPAYLADENGTPIHSWRVLILPYLEEQALYDRYNFNEPWDSPSNKLLLDEIPSAFICPSHGHHGEDMGRQYTNYVFITGNVAAFSAAKDVTLESISDGPSKTIVATDVNRRSVPWTSPRDISIDDFVGMFGKKEPTPQNEPNHDGAIVVVGYADAHAGVFALKTAPQLVRSLVTIAGGETLDSLDDARQNGAEASDAAERE